MQPQPTASAGAPKTGSTSGGGLPTVTDGIQDEAVASTSGSHPVQQGQQKGQLFFNYRASFKQRHQLFGATSRVTLERCDDPAITGTSSDSRVVRKMEEDRDTECNSSDDDKVKVLPVPPAAPSSKQNGSAGTGNRRGKMVSQRNTSGRCTICRKTFNSEYYLKVHMRRHTGEKRYKCDNCGASFWNRTSVTRHNKVKIQRKGVCPQKRSGGWRPQGAWTCNICGKRMRQPSYYEIHMRIHRGEKPFKCGICGQAFPGSSGLCQHKRNHCRVWSYSCVFCDKGFHVQSSYWKHLRGHTKEKP